MIRTFSKRLVCLSLAAATVTIVCGRLGTCVEAQITGPTASPVHAEGGSAERQTFAVASLRPGSRNFLKGGDFLDPAAEVGSPVSVALEEQFGMKLVKRNAAVDYFEIDHIEKPTDN